MELTADTSLKNTWINFHQQNPRIRIRNAARQLQTTEAEIIASFAGSSVLRLKNDFGAFMKRMPELGYVMVLTRNEYAVHERKGVFENVSADSPHVGLVVGKDIDLRMFFSNWAFAFAVFDNEQAAFKKSIQVFDAQGTAVIKVYPQKDSDEKAFEQLVRDFSDPEQSPYLRIAVPGEPQVYNDDAVDEAAFRKAWSELKDTHDFFPFLKKHNVSRLHALHIAGGFAKQVSNEASAEMLRYASANDMEIMVFVGNHGNIQIHTGTVKNIVAIPNWINVMDPQFNLHLRTDAIYETWAVKKPTVDGLVHSIEVFGPDKELIVQFFGKRKPGIPELKEWAAYIDGLTAL
ncbi:hemin-degrading factor [Parafilimonas sp.]|uniref:hemin-degrading factor n=1 Tax=Parafilimonas sp. TaxID=1969739 RepID=UPI0039E3C03B